MDNNTKSEVIYTKAKTNRRMLGHLIDIGIFLLTGIILFTLSNVIIKKTPFYSNKINALTQLRNESKLYVDDEVITSYVQDDTTFPNFEDKKNFLSVCIDEFYHNSTYFSDIPSQMSKYDTRRLAKENLFELNSENVVVEKEGAEASLLYSFYKTEVDDYALIYLYNNINYVTLSRFSFLTTLVEIIIVAFLSFFIFYYIFPAFIFKRGRQTIGMKLLKYGIITVHAVNQGLGIYSLRAVFMFFIFLPINFVSFLIPTFVSLGMMYFTKTNSSLVNYVFNDYMVDLSSQDIYLNDLERIEAQNALKNMSIESKDFTLK